MTGRPAKWSREDWEDGLILGVRRTRARIRPIWADPPNPPVTSPTRTPAFTVAGTATRATWTRPCVCRTGNGRTWTAICGRVPADERRPARPPADAERAHQRPGQPLPLGLARQGQRGRLPGRARQARQPDLGSVRVDARAEARGGAGARPGPAATGEAGT